jgi:hypothetical protein
LAIPAYEDKLPKYSPQKFQIIVSNIKKNIQDQTQKHNGTNFSFFPSIVTAKVFFTENL